MKAIKLFGIAVFALSLCSVMAASAFAGPTWLVDKAEAPAATKVDSTVDSILLEDMGTKVQVIAENVIEGTVGPGGVDEISRITTTKSAFEKEEACKAPLVVEFENLPYTTKLILKEEEVWDDITEGTLRKGVPGWLISCQTIIGNVDDTCTSNEGQTLMTNNAAGAGVSIFFNETIGYTCMGFPGAAMGLIQNITEALILSTEGLELEVDAVE